MPSEKDGRSDAAWLIGVVAFVAGLLSLAVTILSPYPMCWLEEYLGWAPWLSRVACLAVATALLGIPVAMWVWRRRRRKQAGVKVAPDPTGFPDLEKCHAYVYKQFQDYWPVAERRIQELLEELYLTEASRAYHTEAFTRLLALTDEMLVRCLEWFKTPDNGPWAQHKISVQGIRRQVEDILETLQDKAPRPAHLALERAIEQAARLKNMIVKAMNDLVNPAKFGALPSGGPDKETDGPTFAGPIK